MAPSGNHNESPLLRAALPNVMRMARSVGLDLQGTIVSLDGVYDCRRNRKAVFNRGRVPDINANPTSRKLSKRSRKPAFNADIFREGFETIEHVFGWEDKFRRSLLQFERLSQLHYAFKMLAYTMIQPTPFLLTANRYTAPNCDGVDSAMIPRAIRMIKFRYPACDITKSSHRHGNSMSLADHSCSHSPAKPETRNQ